jgi:octaprenyl-diphosphate synthase
LQQRLGSGSAVAPAFFWGWYAPRHLGTIASEDHVGTTITQRKAPSEKPSIEAIRELMANDMAAVDQVIRTRLQSDVVLINQLGAYIVNSGGKRLRPLLALLSARANHGSGAFSQQVPVRLAAIIEFIHTATLLHDDVVDASELRRGRETANAVWGNEASVLVGDFLYSRAFQMMVEINDMRVLAILADTTNTIAEGEVMQLVNCHDPDTSEDRYLSVIRSKTAKLFEAAARLGAVINDRDPEIEQAMAAYGRHIGTAFQLIDDSLDYKASTQELGKNIGDDLAEGKPTLPLLYAMWNGSADQSSVIREAIEQGGRNAIDAVMDAIESTGAIDYTFEVARREADIAIESLEVISPSAYRDALFTLAEFAINRAS